MVTRGNGVIGYLDTTWLLDGVHTAPILALGIADGAVSEPGTTLTTRLVMLPAGTLIFLATDGTTKTASIDPDIGNAAFHAIQLTGLSTGILHADASGNITSGCLDLSADTCATALPIAKGGTAATTAATALLNLGGRKAWVNPPVLSTDAGTIGDESHDPNYYYICTASGAIGAATWKRIALSSF